jgi:hypothetical protein
LPPACAVHVRFCCCRLHSGQGGSIPSLTSLTKEIFKLLLVHSISPVYEWAPRENNVVADRLSKRWDQSWVLTDEASARVRAKFPGVPVVLQRFNTYFSILERLRGLMCSSHPFGLASGGGRF